MAVRCPQSGVGPFVDQGAVESFDFAVGGGVVGLGAGVGDAQFVASVLPCVAAVAVAVVGQDPFDCDAALGEPGHGTVQERDAVDGVFCAGEL